MTGSRLQPALGVALTFAGLVAWVAASAAGALCLAHLFPLHGPWLACVIVCIGGTTALWPFWHLVAALDFLKRGYRVHEVPRRLYPVRWRLGPRDCVFEEVADVGPVRQLPFVRVVLDDAYPAHSEVPMPGPESWDHVVPTWARGRRDEILARMMECFGGPDRGTRIIDADVRPTSGTGL